MIPAFNAGEPLVGVVRRAAEILGGERVLVVNDGSTDGAPGLARAAGARVIDHPVNRGKGAALATGFAAALAEGADGVITLDADGQHDPAWIPQFLEAADGADVVIGSRMREPGSCPRFAWG